MNMRVLCLVTAIFGLAACQTVEGFGQDVEAGGEAIQETSNDVQSEI